MLKNSITKGLSLLLAINFISITPVYSADVSDKSIDIKEIKSSSKDTSSESKIKELEEEIKLLKAKSNQTIKKSDKSNSKPKTGDLKIEKDDSLKTVGDIETKNKTKKEIKEEVKEVQEEDKKVQEAGTQNIYPWLPSMNNIFKGQTIQENQALKPFGYEIFNQDSTVISSTLDAPVGNDYIIGAGDSLEINIWGGVNTSLDVTVDKEGKIVLPEVGTFTVSGRSFGVLKEQIKQKLGEIFNNVSVDVSLTKLRKFKIYVVGEAKNPGAYEISSVNTLFNVLFMAGGPSDIGSLRNISIIRNNKTIKKVDLYDFILKGDKSADVKLENGDTVYFNLKSKTVGIQGLVNRPAIYELKNEKNLADILNLSGGALATSYLKNVQVKRVEANKEMVILNVDLTSKSKLSNLTLKDKDLISIFPILNVNNQTVYLNGHVFRPGTYQYKNKMKLSEIIKSYSDLLPEPYTEYAQIIRLQKPDLKPFTIMFNLNDIIAHKKDIELQPFDTVMIYSKWDFTRVPEIEVTGEIFKPGKYKIVKGTRLLDILSLSGGVTKNTYLDRVEIIRKDDVYGNKKNISISLKNALSGDENNNIEIKDEDLIIFHSNNDISQSKTVEIAGQITKAGSYPLGKGMRVKDLLNLGGSFNKSAYTREAEIIRYINDGAEVKFKTINIDLQKAIAGNTAHNILLQDMDRLLIKQIPNWEDIGLAIELKGQVRYPGVYAVSPNDRLYDVIQRAGGFLNDAYLKGAIFNRKSVMELQKARLDKLIEDIESSILVEETQLTDEESKKLKQEELLLREQRLNYRRQLLQKLRSSQATGRMIIDLYSQNFKNTDNNVKISAGDSLFIPKRPDFVSVQGEVYNQTAIVFKPGKTLGYYLSQAGGITHDGDNSRINLVRVNGSVLSSEDKWFYDIKDEIIEPGDTILVPQLPSKTDYWVIVKDIADITYKTAVAAGIFLINTRNNTGN
ncbi:MAG: SLBB domain-containing protein [Candidatus Sericytochromatia bacterium]